MEAIPKLPMLSFKAKSSSESTSFNNLKLFIAECYHENPDSYSKEVHDLEMLRNVSVRPSYDMDGCSKMKRYYCQLNALLNRFPTLPERQMLSFSWKDAYTNSSTSVTDIRQEMAVVLYNIGALHTQLGAEEQRNTPDSMKIACTHFQCAAWAFENLKEKGNITSEMTDMAADLLIFINKICLAQAQECILEKSLSDNRKPGIVVKVASQIVNYYNSALAVIIASGDDGFLAEVVGGKQLKEWKRYLQFKTSYLSAILFLYQGLNSEEQKKMGERVTLYQLAFEKLEEAKKESKGMAKIDQISDALTFSMDVIEAKRKAAKNENEFIYHEEVPDISTITAVEGANLVTGIAFNVTDAEIMGQDIFHRLVPMKAHEGSSLYSEEKANILRTVGTKIEDRGAELNTFMTSLNTDFLQFDNSVKLPQGIVDRCASLNARPNAIPDLVASMSQLAESCSDVETMLREIKELLQAEEKQEKLYQQTMGSRPNVHFAELSREYQKYQEAHNKAGESNETLRKAMGLHVANLKSLSQPLNDILKMVPQMPDTVENGKFAELTMLLNKVSEMVVQRGQFMNALREGINNDDITSRIVAWGDKDLEELFKKELSKHGTTMLLIDKNLEAQANVLKALTDCYAQCAPSIKTMSDVKYKRDQFFSSLASSYDVYEDLLGKSAKGLEFYRKLHNNVQKLLTRVKAARDVQDEERMQRLRSSVPVTPQITEPSLDQPVKPKLKDFMKGGFFVRNHPVDMTHVPSIRPSPLGSENTTTSTCVTTTSTDIFNTQAVAVVQGLDQRNYPNNYNQGMRSNFNQNVDPSFYANKQPSQTGYTNPIYQGQYYPSVTTPSSDAQNYSYPQQSSTVSASNNAPNPAEGQNTYAQPSYSIQPTMQWPSSKPPPSPQPQPYLSSITSGQSSGSFNQYNQMNQVSTPQNYYASNNSGQSQISVAHTPTYYMSNSGHSQVPVVSTQQNYVNNNSGPIPAVTQTPQSGYAPNSGQSQVPGASNPQNYYATNNNSGQMPVVDPSTQMTNQIGNINLGTGYFTSPSPINQYAKPGTETASSQSCYGQSSNTQISNVNSVQYLDQNITGKISNVNQYSNQSSATQNFNQSGQAFSQNMGGQMSYQSPTAHSFSSAQISSPYDISNQGISTQSSNQNIGQYYQSNTADQNSSGQYQVQGGASNQPIANSGDQFSSQNTTGQYGGYQANNEVSQSNTGQYDYYNQQGYNSQLCANTNAPTPVSQAIGYLQYSTNAGAGAGYQAGDQYQQTNSAPVVSQYPQSNIVAPVSIYQDTNNTATSAPAVSQNNPLATASVPPSQTISPAAPIPVPTKSANIDLLSGIDFTPVNVPIAVPTLLPKPASASAANSVVTEKTDKVDSDVVSTIMDDVNPKVSDKLDQIQSFLLSATQSPIPPITFTTTMDRKSSADNLSICSEISSVDQNFDWESASVKNEPRNSDHDGILGKYKGTLDDQKVVKWFHSEVERMEKFMEGVNIKTLNGSTPLDKKWKELQDRLVKDAAKRTTVVAKLFPEKNRSPDCIPYDHARVKLPTTTDDYINAAYVKDICGNWPALVLAQTPMQNTMTDFWQMVWSQKSKLIVCLHTPTEMLDPFWPTQLNVERSYDDFSVTLLRQFDLTHCAEFNLKLTSLGSEVVHELSILQIKFWPKNASVNTVGVAKNVITSFKQQNTASSANLNQAPVIVNCLTGSERSALCSVAIASVLSTETKRPILINVIDLWFRMCSQRRGVLKDENELESSFQVVLSNAHDLLNKHGIMTSYQMKSAEKTVAAEKEDIKDPLSQLDPLWKLKS